MTNPTPPSSPTEIERKFLVTSDTWREAIKKSTRIEQGYLSADRERAVRVRVKGERAFLTIKGGAKAGGIERLEFEYEIPVADAEKMIAELCQPGTIQKVRHLVEVEGHTFEVDVFEGANAGLIVAELELESIEQSFPRPAWLGEEVSHDTRYLNARLATQPYSTW
jgi:adenylate cyclase